MTNIVIVLILASFVAVTDGNIGKCNLSTPPPGWLITNATGILEYATAGQPTNGSSFCVKQTELANSVFEFQVAYHIDLGSTEGTQLLERRFPSKLENYCVNKNTRIVYCFAFCLNETLQNMVIESALKSNQPRFVAQDIQKTTQLNWAITVMQVDYNNPNTRINASVFQNADVWCSVYIGIKPKLGFDYLYEIQLGKVFK
ncbi:hypothetical protein CAEBREN_23145 [Caenorhabditis brenneri]|uniref:Uncharacterized protein n=1 Tax=Caenorhabditis brenneri TaxID=135651 RepID=G0P671_CAEBE|nr:hypothetical protein CAEBREN_23145 [Caenorhabditis brenneri]